MPAGQSFHRGRARRLRGQRHRWRSLSLLLLVGVLACVTHWSPPESSGYRRTEPVPGAGDPVGARACQDCHASFDEHFAESAAHPDCESCHGPAQLHAHTARAADIRFPSSEDCAACHQVGGKTLLGWSTSTHARAEVICSDCHNPHNRELLYVRKAGAIQSTLLRHAGSTTRMCASCHPEVAAQFDLPSHHPMREGMLECTDCHDPHGNRRQALGANRTQMCTACHQEVAGPWIHEHPPVTEDCGYCHAPHGTSADYLMETSQPAACISCHSIPIAGAVHQPWAFSSDCTNCHNAIHGSYAEPHLRR